MRDLRAGSQWLALGVRGLRAIAKCQNVSIMASEPVVHHQLVDAVGLKPDAGEYLWRLDVRSPYA